MNLKESHTSENPGCGGYHSDLGILVWIFKQLSCWNQLIARTVSLISDWKWGSFPMGESVYGEAVSSKCQL